LDRLGISEPIIYPGKDNRIIIQLPGIDEAKRQEAEKMIHDIAFLEFRILHEKNGELVKALMEKSAPLEGYAITEAGGEKFYKEDASFPPEKRDAEYRERIGRFNIPSAAYEFLLEKVEKEGRKVYRPCFAKRRRELTGQDLKRAGVDYRALQQPVVKLEFDGQGAKKFAKSPATTHRAASGTRIPTSIANWPSYWMARCTRRPSFARPYMAVARRSAARFRCPRRRYSPTF